LVARLVARRSMNRIDALKYYLFIISYQKYNKIINDDMMMMMMMRT